VAVLRNGRLVQIGAPDQLYNHPADSFVASFIGESTLLPVKRVGPNEVALGDCALRSARSVPDAGELLLAVQTEKLLIHEGSQGNLVNRFSCRVSEIVYQGESLRIFATLADGHTLSLRQPSHHAARSRIPAVGEEVTVTLAPEDTIVVPRAFDAPAASLH